MICLFRRGAPRRRPIRILVLHMHSAGQLRKHAGGHLGKPPNIVNATVEYCAPGRTHILILRKQWCVHNAASVPNDFAHDLIGEAAAPGDVQFVRRRRMVKLRRRQQRSTFNDRSSKVWKECFPAADMRVGIISELLDHRLARQRATTSHAKAKTPHRLHAWKRVAIARGSVITIRRCGKGSKTGTETIMHASRPHLHETD